MNTPSIETPKHPEWMDTARAFALLPLALVMLVFLAFREYR
ncbi:hypothetical protein [Asticcacaulis taihuensis]|jgi:hypothetical protein|nr:hypothetical protein [Asticcacaulis taihuensis]